MAIEMAEKALEVDPSFPGGYSARGLAEVEKGMYDRAIADFEEANKLRGLPVFLGRIGYAYAISGRTTQATDILAKIKNQSDSGLTKDPEDFLIRSAFVHIGLGNTQLAIDLLEKATNEHTPSMTHLKSDPIYARIREEPRFRTLLRKVSLDD
jgi:tetratricopeptide (TPR) repeat protein